MEQREQTILRDHWNGFELCSGSLKNEDLANAIRQFIEPAPELEGTEELRLLKALLADFFGTAEENTEDRMLVMDDIFELLQEIAPDGCYFGSAGASFGFWPYDEEA